jgi:hypothetical protein
MPDQSDFSRPEGTSSGVRARAAFGRSSAVRRQRDRARMKGRCGGLEWRGRRCDFMAVPGSGCELGSLDRKSLVGF